MLEVESATAAAQLHEAEFPKGYETIVGENGNNISGGQCQRITIARAIIKGARIVLMDEPMSRLDNTTQHGVQTALDKLLPGRTAIIAAHRLHTIKQADNVIVLKDGQIQEEGAPDDLDVKRGAYYEMLKAREILTSN